MLTYSAAQFILFYYLLLLATRSYRWSKELQTEQEWKLLQGNLSQQNYFRNYTIKEVHWFFSYVCNGKFAVFWVLCCGITCKWVLLPTIDLYFYQLKQIVRKYKIDSVSRARSILGQKLYVHVFQLAKKRLCCRAFSFLTVFCACVRRN